MQRMTEVREAATVHGLIGRRTSGDPSMLSYLILSRHLGAANLWLCKPRWRLHVTFDRSDTILARALVRLTNHWGGLTKTAISGALLVPTFQY